MQSLDDTSETSLSSGLVRLSSIAGPAGELEIAFRKAVNPKGENIAVICHPHPLHGGTMDNKVVTTLSRIYSKMGWHSLRFNFRGVGASSGSYGELSGEIEDLQAVVGFVRDSVPAATLCLAGFSFGSAVAANVARDGGFAHLLLVAPPVGKYDLDYPESFPCPTLVVQGELDDVVDLEQTRRWAGSVKGEFRYCEIPDTGHFFHGKLTELADVVSENFLPHGSPT